MSSSQLLAQVLSKQRQHFINGQFTPSLHAATAKATPGACGGSIAVVNPATESILSNIARGGPLDVEASVAAAKKALESGSPWAESSGRDRALFLTRFSQLLHQYRSDLAEMETLDNGKPLEEALGDVDGAVACLDVMAKQASELDARQDRHVPLDYSLKYIPGTAAYSCRLQEMPVGVVAAITPWNYPLQMAIWKIAPLLAAGCTCVLKPSEVTPLSALALALLTNEAGLPPGVFNVITGLGGEVGQPLAEHVDVAKVAFTGSTTVGAHLMNVAAKQVKNITLELGGKSALIVFEDAVETLERTVDLVIAGVFSNSGQICSSTSRLIVHESIHELLLDRLITKTKETIIIGDGLASKTVNMGPVVNRTQYDKVRGMIQRAIDNGDGKLVCGGVDRPETIVGVQDSEKGFFIRPTIFMDVKESSEIWKNEIFGPVLSIRTFSTEQEALAMANDTNYGLAAGVVTQDVERLARVSRHLKAGIVWENCNQNCYPEAPWGGIKMSGIGRELGPDALKAYLEVKQIVRYHA